MNSEQKMFVAVANRLENRDVRRAFYLATQENDDINLPQELRVINRCFDKVNEIISSSNPINADFAGIRDTKMLLVGSSASPDNPGRLFNPLTKPESKKLWAEEIKAIIEVGNREIGPIYTDPAKINNGNPLSVFEWYLYDGAARMVAIHMGISNDNKKQEEAGDSIACALAEAAVILAEEGDSESQAVVENMLNMEFITKGWLLTDGLVERAKRVSY